MLESDWKTVGGLDDFSLQSGADVILGSPTGRGKIIMQWPVEALSARASN